MERRMEIAVEALTKQVPDLCCWFCKERIKFYSFSNSFSQEELLSYLKKHFNQMPFISRTIYSRNCETKLVQLCVTCSKKFKLEFDVGCLICEQPCQEQFTLDYVMVNPLNRTEVRTCSRKCLKKFLKFSRPKGFFKTICFFCSKEVEKRKYCSRCKKACYCSVECQTQHWSKHKLKCQQVN